MRPQRLAGVRIEACQIMIRNFFSLFLLAALPGCQRDEYLVLPHDRAGMPCGSGERSLPENSAAGFGVPFQGQLGFGGKPHACWPAPLRPIVGPRDSGGRGEHCSHEKQAMNLSHDASADMRFAFDFKAVRAF